ncbi:MAG: preprotein translocase subunit SecG [Planctomycetes bacterium]|nr:preprotein translocase subunit SecG [Planctomycetota bacterium]
MEYLEMVVKGIFVVVALLMTFFILLQEGKGGGLTGLGGTKAAGVEGVTNPIRRFTGYLAGIFFVLAIVLGLMAREPGSGISVTEPGKERLSSGEDKDASKDGDGMGGAFPDPDVEGVEKDPKSSIKTVDTPAGEKTDEPKTGAAEKAGEAKTPELVTKTEAEKTVETDAPAEAKTETKSEAPAEKSPPAE